jgi:putative hemolysin
VNSTPALQIIVADKGGPFLTAVGSLEVRLAQDERDVRRAQKLRYDVFYREMAAQASPEMAREERDFDRFDDFCDHMLVIDKQANDAVVGTYRLLRREVADAHGGFYTAGEYDIAPMLAAHPPSFRFLELGRSCVLKSYRTGATMQLLWRGMVVYISRHRIDLMFGCASFAGTDPKELALPLSYLHHYHLAPAAERVSALSDRYVGMNMLPIEAVDKIEGLKAVPPLIKGYLRTGSFVGDGAVIDRQFGTTDVFIYFPVSRVNPRWLDYYRKKMGTS